MTLSRFIFVVSALALSLFMPATGQAQGASSVLLPARGTSIDVDVTGTLYVLDADANTLVAMDREGRPVARIGGAGWESSRFDRPSGLWARNGLDIVVADYGNHRVQRFDKTLSFVSELATRESDKSVERFGYPADVALSRFGDLYVCDGENVRIVKFGAQSVYERAFGGIDAGPGRLRAPVQVEPGPRDRVYVLDQQRVLIYDPFGNYLGRLGEAILRAPSAIFADDAGAVVVDGDSTFVFGGEDQLAGVIPSSGLTGLTASPIRSIVAGAGRMYALTADGVWVTADPRAVFIDKDSESR
jgi:DNA-binding beta-propeller fold protein YncE